MLFEVVLEEIKYKRYDRYDWSSRISLAKENIPIRIDEGYFSANDVYAEFPIRDNATKLIFANFNGVNHNYGEEQKNEVLPDSLNIDWFSFAENQFYKVSEQLPGDKISSYLKDKGIKRFEFILVFKKQGLVDVFVNEAYTEEAHPYLVAKVVGSKNDKDWEIGDRLSDVKVMNSNIVITPELVLNSKSLLQKLRANYKNNASQEFDAHLEPRFVNYTKEEGPIMDFSLDLKNENRYQDEVLNIYIRFANKELAEMIDIMGSRATLEIELDDQDSLKSIYFENKQHRFLMTDFEPQYDLRTDYRN